MWEISHCLISMLLLYTLHLYYFTCVILYCTLIIVQDLLDSTFIRTRETAAIDWAINTDTITSHRSSQNCHDKPAFTWAFAEAFGPFPSPNKTCHRTKPQSEQHFIRTSVHKPTSHRQKIMSHQRLLLNYETKWRPLLHCPADILSHLTHLL